MMKWILLLVLALPVSSFASENCAEQYKGTCRDSCAKDETAAEGAFIDCTEKQDCCVPGASREKDLPPPEDAGKPDAPPEKARGAIP